MDFFANFHKDSNVQPSHMIKIGSMGKRYFGETTGPLITRKYATIRADKTASIELMRN